MDNSTQYEISVPSSRMTLFYDEIYSSGLDRTARFPVDRYSMIAQKITEEDGEGLIQLKQPRLAKREEVLLAHDAQFVDRFLAQQLREDEIRRIGLRPWKPEIVERTMRLVGGALEGLDLLQAGVPIAGNMAGGTHHAFRGEGAGYCIFNDLAVCAEVALQRGQAERVLVLDLDVHQGDGTAEIFQGDDRVFTVSVHGQDNFPFRKKKSDLDIGLPKGAGDAEFLSAVDQAIEEVSGQSFDLLFFQAGVDALGEDALGLLNVTRAGMKARNERAFAWRRELGVPMLLFMGGGYSSPIDHTVDAFADLFFGAAREYRVAQGVAG
jgi:acetoin utilization deacetylase AcuC-like enzyme